MRVLRRRSSTQQHIMAAKDFTHFSIRRKEGQLEVLDQRKLPDLEEWLAVDAPEDMAQFIKQLSVRGAPLIGKTSPLIYVSSSLFL